MITPEQHAEIRRLYYGEHWKVGTIAAALGVHHETVRAAIAHDTKGIRRGTCRATRLDPYLPLIRDTLAQYPRLRATRVFEMVKARGYTGSVVQLRRAVRLIRPAATATVYRRLTTLAAEEAHVDWGAFGSIRIGRGVRPLSGFVMVLAYSIPHTHVRRPLTLVASPTTIRVLAGTEEIARHARSYDTGQVIAQEAHVAGLIDATRQANPSSARDRLRLAVPAATTLLERLAARGESLRAHTARLLALLDDDGPQELGGAMERALERDVPGAGAIAHILEIRRRQRGLKPPIPMALPDRPGVRDLDVTPHRLETYDELTRSDSDDPE
jgi:hypothetical protein